MKDWVKFQKKLVCPFGLGTVQATLSEFLQKFRVSIWHFRSGAVVVAMECALEIMKRAFLLFKNLSRYLHKNRGDRDLRLPVGEKLVNLDSKVFEEIKTLHQYLVWDYWGRTFHMYVWYDLDDLKKGMDMHWSLSRYLRDQMQYVPIRWERLSDLPEGEKYRFHRILHGNPFDSDRPMLLIKERTIGWITDPWKMEIRLVMMKTKEWDRVSRPEEGDTIMRKGCLYVKTDP